MNEPIANSGLTDTSAGSMPAIGGSVEPQLSTYDRFELEEALCVASHYDLGVIHAAQEFRRGSRRSPKLLIKCDRGLFILKRMAPGRDDPTRVAFTHDVQRVLAGAGFPLPRLIALRGSNETMLRLGTRVYELFECVNGQSYDHSPEATMEAGAMLARLHSILESQPPQGEAPSGSYHRLAAVPANLAFIPHRLPSEGLQPVTDFLREAYERASERAEAAGLMQWRMQLIHGDWHPGNLLFKGAQVAAVIDYDTVRQACRAVDIANGALQFSLTRTGNDPGQWPDSPDETRLKRFCQGYDSATGALISRAELDALPWLMIEAIIAESALPIAATGRFGRLEPTPFLRMVERKVRWLQAGHDRILRLVS